MKDLFKKFTVLEWICLAIGAICCVAILILLLSAKGDVRSVLPAVVGLGILNFVAQGGFQWRKDKKRAIMVSVCGTLICVTVLVMLATGKL